jgi:N-acetylneuraminate lyase
MSLMFPRLRGLVAAPFTPFLVDGSLNLEPIADYAHFLHANGVIAAFVCGTTGEGFSLTLDERRRVAERWMTVAPPGLRVIVHVGDTVLENSRALAAHAGDIGAAAISTVAPIFFKPRDNDELTAWCEAVAAAAPTRPFYYYHIPSMTGVTLPVAGFLAQAAERIPTLAGSKFTHENLDDFAACVEFASRRFDVLFGRDERLLDALDRGAQGAVGSTFNYAAPLYRRLIAAWERGQADEARALQATAVRMIALCNEAGVTHLAASKALMPMLGIDCGPVRPPLKQPTVAAVAHLRQQLAGIGFFEFGCRPLAKL